MGTWTTKNGNAYSLNIDHWMINRMKTYGARLCWMRDNRGILDENSDYYEDYNEVNDGDGGDGGVIKGRKLKEGIIVVCEDGDSITGYVTHWVKGPCSGTDEQNWFIIQPGTYPTYCNEKMFVEDL